MAHNAPKEPAQFKAPASTELKFRILAIQARVKAKNKAELLERMVDLAEEALDARDRKR